MSGPDAESPLAQYQRLKSSCVRVSAPAMARFSVSGKDAEAYLHRRLSQSIKGLAPGKGVHALQLGGDGRMECDLLVYRSKEGFEIVTGAEHAETAAAITEKFTLMDDVTVTPRWADEQVLIEAGPGQEEILRFNQACKEAGRPELPMLRDPRWKLPVYYSPVSRSVIQDAERILGEIDPELGSKHTSSGIDEAVFEFARIEEGISRFGVDTNPQTIPLEAGLTDAIDFDKGCFPGQEVLAKIRNLGHPARQFVRLEIEGEHLVAAGSAISAGDSEEGANAGEVTSSATIPGIGRTLALGFVKWPFRDAADARVETGGSRPHGRMMRLFEWQETGFRTRP